MSTEKKSSGAPTALLIVIGLILMFGGGWLDQNWHPEFLETLKGQGIPLEPGKTVSVIGVFLILFPVIKSFFLNPLTDAINQRNQELETTFTDAEQLRAQMQTMRADYEQRLAATEAEARSQIQAQIKEAQDLRQSLMAEASAKADELVKQATAEIESEKQKVLSQLRTEVVNLTLAASEKVLGENMDTDKNRKLVAEFIDKVEVPS